MDGKFLYFFIKYQRKSKENPNDIIFVEPENKELKPEPIFVDEIVDDPYYYYNKIYKVSKSAGKGKKGNNYHFEFEIDDEKYIIKFDSKGSTFIYDVNLEVGKRIIDIRRKINQNKEYYETIEFFINALKNIGEEKIIDDLYKETIKLYENKKGFTFLIVLFLKIYQKEKLCSELIQIFKKMNENPKDNEKNMDRKSCLRDYSSKFRLIKSEADKIIDKNNYNLKEFYGIILCYLNYYDFKTFSSVINDLYTKKPEDLYEILLIYNSHFKYPINQNLDFFNNFISYAIANKDFPIFEKGLNYIKDIETFLNIIDKNKDAIYKKYNAQKIEKIIKLDKLKLKKNVKEDKKQNENVSEGTVITENTKEQCTEDSNSNKNKKEIINEVIKNIKSIIKFCKEENTFLIYFTNNFWQYILNYYNEPTIDNIKICFDLREIFIRYYDLVLKIFEKKEAKFTIKKEVISYFERDEFAFLLDQIIRKYNDNPEVRNIEKLRFITQYNPYYRESKYFNKVDCGIFDFLDLAQIDNDFIKYFRRMNFEYIFKDNISEYIKKFIEKINNIPNFDTVIQLINIRNLQDKNIYLDLLNKRYDIIISNDIALLNDDKLKEAIHVVAKIAIFNYAYEEQKKKFDFIKNRVKKLAKIIPLIFIEIINICFNKEDKNSKEEENENNSLDEDENKNEEIKEEDNNIEIDYTEMKNYIFDEFSNKLSNENDIDNIINLIDCLERKDSKKDTINEKDIENEAIINEFLEKLMEKNLFSKDEFFSGKQNIKISLFYKLNEKGKIQKNEQGYYENIIHLFDEIKKDIEGNIKKSKLEEFLKNEPTCIKQRLSLIKLILGGFNPDDQYKKLKDRNDEINKDLNGLRNIKDNIIIYHKDCYQDIINKIIEVIKNNQNKKIIDYKGGKIGDLIKETEKKGLGDLAIKINEVKNLLLFDVIYGMNLGRDEEANFDYAYKTLIEIKENLQNSTDIIELNNKYKEIFKRIKEKLSNNEDEANNFIKKLAKYCEIENNTKLINELTILFKSKKYELDINSIIFFFENYFVKDNDDWNNKLPPKNFIKKWEENFQNIKEDLNRLKENGIYNYEKIGNYNKLFTCLYDKKEAIDFLFSKTSEEILKLKDKIQPTDRTISIKDILDTEKCVYIIDKLKKIGDNSGILEYIKKLDDKTISQFENYSKIYSSVIELDDTDEDISDNVYDKVIDIITDATINILQDTENLIYKNKKNEEVRKEEKIMEDLVHIKNQIHIKNEKENNEDDIIKSKCKILIFFKETISDLEVINEYMKILRKKGSSLPIKISIKIRIKDKEPTIEYYLGKEKKDFQSIREFLFEAKNSYISQIGSLYKEKLNLRFLYGKQFRSMMKHLENNYKIDSFLRYILNITNNNILIEEGYKTVVRYANDYIKQHKVFNEDSLNSISAYITSLFKSNGKTLEDHYQRMKIISNDLKGIYLYKCENISMEEYIINLFLDKLTELPISQNVLITNKETSSEEIQAFFHRAILCNYNTLFVVEINDSFSEYQQSVMNTYIDNLLTYKNDEYNKTNDDKADKKMTNKYLDSCIVFIHDRKNKNITPFLKEIEKYNSLEEEVKIIQDKAQQGLKSKLMKRNSTSQKLNIFHLDSKDKNRDIGIKNIFVITSDICGLGKSEKIKKKIKDSNKTYFHFPLGGILTKRTIFDKLFRLLNEIENEIKNNNKSYKDIAIHLDLTESEEASIINEFFFSFLITRFYTNDENMIYIPKDIFIYIEIPNCFEDYLSKFGILKIFDKENITFENMSPFDYPEEIRNIFKNMYGIYSNEEIEKFVKKYIGIPKYSYHQINIFVKLFISQYSKLKKKIHFKNEQGKDVTEECVLEFANCTKYFTNGGFAQLLTGIKKTNKTDFIDMLSETYENDLSNMEFPAPLIFIFQEKKTYDAVYFNNYETNTYKSSKDYLAILKSILDLPYTEEDLLSIIEEENNNYVITNDNFKKMVLLIYRIVANIPVIIMGDTGCGKTSLITKLNQILNGGKTTLKIINIHPGITDEILCEKMEEANKEADDLKSEGKDLWVFFDEMNTCLSLSLLTEIFINRNYNGKKFSDNIRLIGACNPYRKRKGNKEKCGLSISDDNDNELVYLVNPLPQSLLYYVFSFGAINENDEKKYIHSIIEKLFTKEEQYLHEMTRDAISKCHIYLRQKFDPSVVSLREIARFSKCIDFFKNYFETKNIYEKRTNNEKNNKLRSIICSIYLCYYIRLTDQKIRFNFEAELRSILLKLVNNEESIEGNTLMEQIKNQDLKNEIEKRPDEIINNFSDFLKIEQDYLIDQIELDKGIGKNALLKENIFLLFLSVITSIPLIIIGKPGTGKSLSAQLIYKSMRGKYSKNKFFQQFPQIIQTYFQGSESTQPEDVERLFKKAGSKLKTLKDRKKKEIPIIMVLFDELGLAERSKSNPLKVLHEKLEYTGKEEGVSFVGISNYSLDAAKINRALVLSVPDLDQKLDDLIQTSENIVESISDKLKKEPIFEIISKTYFGYKRILQIIKELIVYKEYVEKDKKEPKVEDSQKSQDNEQELANNASQGSPTTIEESKNKNNVNESSSQSKPQDREKRQFEFIKGLKDFTDLLKKENKIRKDFHGNRDFYNLIKGIAIELKSGESTEKEKVSIIIKYIERNFGGIEYEIDIDFNLVLEDTKKNIELIKNIIDDYEYTPEENKNLKLSSVFLFKKLYNLECDKVDPNSNLKIDKLKLNDYNLNNCINDNIKDVNSRYLLLEIKPSLTPLIYQNIKLQNQLKAIELYDGSPFVDDNNKEYRFKIINKIQEDAKEDKLIIIENLNQIHPFLFDLYNMNYIIKDDKKLVRICLENFNEQLTLVNEKFRVIILVDRKFVNNCDLAFLNRLEKMILSFDNLLDSELRTISKNLIDDIKLRTSIRKYRNINFSLRDLLINCRNEDIQAMIYYFSKALKKEESEENEDQEEKKLDIQKIRENVINKIYKILPQDIICILQDSNVIRRYYTENIIYYNFNDYIKDEENKKYKISIIYTYTSIANIFEGLNKEMRFMVSQIRSEDGLKHLIEEIKNKNEKNKSQKEYNIFIDFELSNSKKIKFISNFVLNNFKDDNYNYIFIIHINRNFNKNNRERIYSLPDINPLINQIFIDNLNGNNNIVLKELLTRDIKQILEERREDMKLDEEFHKTLINTLTKELNDKFHDDNIIDDYINELQKFMDEEKAIKDKIIEVAYKIIDNNKDNDSKCRDIIDKLYKNSYINKYTVDITSCLIEYIKDNIFNSYIKKVLLKLENNNILTTLIELRKKGYKEINKSLVEEITKKCLDEIATEKNETKPISKFLFNYNIPGLYNFYEDFSSYISKNITSIYFNNEKKLREALQFDDEKKRQFHDTEDFLLNDANKYISNNKFISEILNKVPHDLLFKDYITYYLQKHRKNNECVYNKDDAYHKLIELLLSLRFKQEKNLNGLIMKIIWIESNVNYILNILKIFDNAIPIFNYNNNKLLNKIEEIIFKSENKIKYITNKQKNPEHTKEVNECYYILLASICYSITSDEVQLSLSTSNKNNENGENNENNNTIEINHYYYILIDIYKILQNLNDDLYIYLNEMYIIDELIKIIELFTKKKNIEKINEIKNLMKDNAMIIQKNSDNEVKLNDELINNFESIYNSIIKDEIIDKNDRDYYDKLRYILFKEIKKIPNIDYRFKILEKLLESNEMIKKSNDIFQMLLKNYVKKEYKSNRNTILTNGDDIIKILDETVNKNFVLAETLLYFFEKNALNYLKNILNSKKEIINDKKKKETVIIKLENEPLDILKDCYDLLNIYIFDSKKLDSKFKEVGKLFCLGYTKSYIHTFIKTFEDEKPKFEDSEKIIKILNGDNSIYKMMRIYIYKILYNNLGVDAFVNQKMVEKYQLKKYKDFTTLIPIKDLNNIYKIDYQIRSLKDDYYEQSNKIIEKYQKDNFKNPMKDSDFDIGEFGIDNFYIISYNIVLSNLPKENSDYNTNFFKNICEPLFKKDKLLFKAIELFYNPTKNKDIIKNFKIDSNNIKAILFGYRYCLNALSSKNTRGIYYSLYDSHFINNIKNYYYPGNDIEPNKVYFSIINHFRTKPNEGCYACLCSKGGHYHCVKSGFPGYKELNMICSKCSKNIGAYERGIIIKEQVIVKREGYYRIFKSQKEIDEIKKDKDLKNKLNEINYITLDEYKKKYIKNENDKAKGIFIHTDKNYFKNDKKIVRNLSQISFRILNYILYSHLFFARLVTNKNQDFDKYLPKGMTWAETLNECWNILKNQLLKQNIDSIEKFMSYIFSDLFPILNTEKRIDNYESYAKFESNLETNIQKIIKKYKEDINKNNLIKRKNDTDKSSFIFILKEIYKSSDYKKEEYPFYEYFYFTDYLNEEYISEKLSHMDENKYPVLKSYLESKKTQKADNYSLENLNLFNSVLNLINEKYSNKIPREYAEKKKLKDEEIYNNNKNLIDKFITFYNDLKLSNQKLSTDNYLIDFLLDSDNKFGKTYKNIYEKFAKEQNEKLENLLDSKIESGIFDINCKNKINIQQINEKEIFTLSFQKQNSFIDILFDASYRKILDNEARSNELYKEYEINYDLIEENMTEQLLKNKKLLNGEITEFIYNNEVFANQVTNLITSFKKKYNKNISIYDKVAIYKFYKDNSNNPLLFKNMINDFIELIKYLNDKKKENEDKIKENTKTKDIDITEETKISDVVNKLNDTFSNEFIKIFENNEGLTVDKASEIFLYYLKLSFDFIKDQLKNYQNELDDKTKEAIKNYYQIEHPISQKNFACAIRLFTTLVLFLEEDKENKIKSNRNNLVNYLKAPDLWNKDIYENDDFNKNLNELKLFNAQINQILSLYETLGKDIEPNFVNDVLDQIEKENKPTNPPEEITSSGNDNNVYNGGNSGNGGNGGNDEEDDDDDMFAADEENDNEDGPRD